MIRSEAGTVRVLAAVVRRGDRLLSCRRPANKRHGGLWEFPGGKLEPGETDLEAARRELQEELDVNVRSVEPVEFSVHDPGSEFVIEFLPVECEGEPKCIEHSAHAWVTLDELIEMALAPSDRKYAEFLVARRNEQND
jgi:mutator protein MutT